MIKESFKRYLEEAIGRENALVAFSAFSQQASVAVRYNPFKNAIRYEGKPVMWNRWGCMLDQRPVFTLDPHFHGGAYYVQDSSSMFVGDVFRKMIEDRDCNGRPIRVLDLCAAPGGKTTDLSASLREKFGNDFLLVANEVMKQRAGVLASNVALWGDPNVVVTSDDPKAFSAFEGFFDVILADVPCSGEGMFRKDEEAQQQWSENNVSLCESRQRRIIADVWPSLAQGGILIYSTCTFNRYENDGNVEWICRELGAEPFFEEPQSGYEGVICTKSGFSLVPGFVPGEGQYCSAVRKSDTANPVDFKLRQRSRSKAVQVSESIKSLLTMDVVCHQRGETLIAVPENIAELVSLLDERLHVISSGCALGTIKGKDFVPDADLALSLMLKEGSYPACHVDRKTALSFLHRDAISVQDVPKGYVLIVYEGVPLGFVKNLGNRSNNLYPQSRRIRMDV